MNHETLINEQDIGVPLHQPAPFLTTIHIPVALGVQAGFPSPAADYMENPIDLNEHIIQHPAATFFVRIEGESMTGAHIPPGALLVVDRSLRPKDGVIVLAVVNGEFTCKRLQFDFNKRYLMPENSKYKPIEITEETDCTIWGVVTHIIIDAKTV